MSMSVRAVEPQDLANVTRVLTESWGGTTVVALGRGELIDAVRAAAAERGATRLCLVTTNDNTHALRFYQRYGFDLIALHRHGVDRARDLKPGIPAESDGIPIRHELELELIL
ncbi:GNAT family N-acetyltransferase [Nonomuraea sp. NPDC049695]|uniref:GNAT family N-acetyltransferase n=1 Tax=Nonomuraea sp. NPDC049695 TaxID=3154734 RepID=UPI00342DA80B